MPRGDWPFPRDERMQSQQEFDQVKQEGVSCSGQYLVLAVNFRPCESAKRVGFIISKRVGRAVTRNRIRRRLREVYRLRRPGIVDGFSMVLIARPAAAHVGFDLLDAEFARLFLSIRRKICEQA